MGRTVWAHGHCGTGTMRQPTAGWPRPCIVEDDGNDGTEADAEEDTKREAEEEDHDVRVRVVEGGLRIQHGLFTVAAVFILTSQNAGG